jgi:hypothetical protein
MLHHELYLDNSRPPIDRLEITHGFNQVIFSLIAPTGGWRWRFGLGLVVAHPEGEIGGRPIGPLRTVRIGRSDCAQPGPARAQRRRGASLLVDRGAQGGAQLVLARRGCIAGLRTRGQLCSSIS